MIAHNMMSGEPVRGTTGMTDTIDKRGMTSKMTGMAPDLIGKTPDTNDQKDMKDPTGKMADMRGATGKTDRKIKTDGNGESFQSPRHRERMIRARKRPVFSRLQETSEPRLQDHLLCLQHHMVRSLRGRHHTNLQQSDPHLMLGCHLHLVLGFLQARQPAQHRCRHPRHSQTRQCRHRRRHPRLRRGSQSWVRQQQAALPGRRLSQLVTEHQAAVQPGHRRLHHQRMIHGRLC